MSIKRPISECQEIATAFLFSHKPKDYLFTNEDRKSIMRLAGEIERRGWTKH